MAMRRERGGGQRHEPYGGGPRGGNMGGAREVSLMVHIPEELAGGVIGKGGQVIADIRKNSGASVRMVSLIALARHLVEGLSLAAQAVFSRQSYCRSSDTESGSVGAGPLPAARTPRDACRHYEWGVRRGDHG